MRKITPFQDFNLNEALVPGGWPTDWKDMPEWERLVELGFRDTTNPLQAKNQTIMLDNARIPIYPAGIVLQKSGYIRDKGVTSGFIKNYNPSGNPYSLKTIFDYLIDRYEKEVNKRVRSEKHGPLSDEAINQLLLWCKDFVWNPNTESVDVKGDVNIKVSNFNQEILDEIKFGRVLGNFLCGSLDLTNLNFAPDFVGKDFNCSHNLLTSLEGSPKEVRGNFTIYSNGRKIKNLMGSPRKIGQNFMIGFGVESDCLESLVGAPEEVDGNFNLSDSTGTVIFIDSGKWGFEGFIGAVSNNFEGRYPDSRVPTWSSGEKGKKILFTGLPDGKLDDYFKDNPLELYILDELPEVKKGVLERTGIKDLSHLGRSLKKGLI